MIQEKKLLGYTLLITGVVLAPLFPFYFLLLFPVVAIVSGLIIAPLLFAAVADSFFLLADASVWGGLMPYTLLFLVLYQFAKRRIVLW